MSVVTKVGETISLFGSNWIITRDTHDVEADVVASLQVNRREEVYTVGRVSQQRTVTLLRTQSEYGRRSTIDLPYDTFLRLQQIQPEAEGKSLEEHHPSWHLSEQAVEQFIAALPWSPGTDDEHVTLVAGNIRNFAQHLREAMAGKSPG